MRHLSDIKSGQVIGRYEFLAPIAQGGMAAVWAARQRGSRGFSRVVAIKTMLPSISEDPRFERMFLDEAQIASRIRHEHVVEILDLGEENEILYLVMEWVDGESLSVLRRRAERREGIPLRLAVRVVADVCAGLHAAHELAYDDGRPVGLVHRDVSPQNILVGYDGNVKILDFGVAKVAGRTADTTNIGHARGKPPYMAPEQALGKAIDRRADVFSLGIIFYQLLVGRHPFRGENDIATLHNIISDQAVVRPSEVLPTMTQAVEAVALRAIDRDPDQRFQTAQEFELALEAVLDTQLGRVRAEEIGRFMAETMGPAQEDRRSAIRDAIRLADSDEPTQLDVSFGSPILLGVAGRSLALDDATVAGSASEAVPGTSTHSPSGAAGQMLQVQSAHVVRAKNASAVVLPPQHKMFANGWWQVLLAMATGAVLAWLVTSWLSRSTSHGSTTRDSAAHDATAKVVPTQIPDVERNELSALPTSQSGDTRNARRAVTPRRTPTSGNRSAAGGAVNQLNLLPPVPSPGF